MLAAPPSLAHTISPEDVVAVLASEPMKQEWGLVRVSRDPKLPRLLIIEVNASWQSRDAAARRSKAADWLNLWKHSVPTGIVAILDEKTQLPVVEFRASGAVDLKPPN